MAYVWEVLKSIWRVKMVRINEPLPLHLSVIGLAVVNTDHVEAACLQIEDQTGLAMI
jgi:hypothetical protein